MQEKMKGIVFTGPQKVEIMEFEMPVITPSEVLVRHDAFAICTVEQRMFKSENGYPNLGGHEVCGTVVAVGADVRGYQVGDRVVPTYPFCGYCENCMRGRGTKCLNLDLQKKRVISDTVSIRDGGMLQYNAVPAAQLVKIGKDVPLELAVLSEPLACCIHSVSKTKVEFGDTCVVIGAGVMGLLHTKLLRMKGARVIVSEMDPARREKALKAGANLVVNPAEEDAVDFVKRVTEGVGADVVINTTSIYQVGEQAIQMLASHGRLIAYASLHPAVPIPVNFGQVHHKEIEIIGTVSPRPIDYVAAAKLIKYGLIHLEDVLEAVFPMEQAQAAFERAIAPDSYRCVVAY